MCKFLERWFERRFERNSRAPRKFCECWVERRSDYENESWVERRSLFGERTKGMIRTDFTSVISTDILQTLKNTTQKNIATFKELKKAEKNRKAIRKGLGKRA